MRPEDDIRTPMTGHERRATAGLAGIYALRMLGLFLVLPVLSIHADRLRGATPALVGLAIGAYGIGQALFQIPFGMWSDRLGRKLIITLGLVIFAAGSALAALATSIDLLLLGRFLQGTGAVSAVAMALTADLTRDSQRTKAMACIGISIGASFAVSMVAAPPLTGWIGVPGIFWLIAAMSLAAIGVLYTVVPPAPPVRFQRDALPALSQFATVMRRADLLRLDFGILALHAIVTAAFVVLPRMLRDQFHIPAPEHWKIYLPVMAAAIVAMVPLVAYAEIKRRLKPVFLGAVLLLAASALGAWRLHSELYTFCAWLFLFFTGFNLLEATLPSLISKTAPPHLKGTAMGVYSTAQFLGAFIGGSGAGLLYGRYDDAAVFVFCAGWALLWWLVALPMRPRYLKTLRLDLAAEQLLGDQDLARRLSSVEGVVEVALVAEESAVYLKVDQALLDSVRLHEQIAAPV